MKAKHLRALLPGTIVSAAALLCSTGAVATTILYEGFDIPPGEIDFESGATSWGFKLDNGGQQLTWWSWDQANNDLYHGVSDGGLEWEGLNTVGNAFEFHDEATEAVLMTYRLLPRFYQYSSSGHLWVSALFQAKIEGNPDNGGFFQLCVNDSHPQRNDIYMGISNARDFSVWSAGGERLYVNGERGEKWGFSEVPVEEGVTAFLVMHLNFEEKTAAFWANPPVDVDDPGPPDVVYEMLTDLFVDRIALWVLNLGPANEGEGADYTGSLVDEIRMGDSYASVSAGADTEDPGGGGVDTDPPVITGPSGSPGDASSSASIDENTVKVTDMKANEDAVWEISGGADGSFFTIGVGTGGLSFAEPPDFEEPLDSNSDNVYIVEVKATDIAGNSSTQVILVTVLDVDDSGDVTPPVITGPSGSPGNDAVAAEIEENTTLVFDMEADEEVTWSIGASPDQDLFTIDATTGVLEFVTAPDFENPTDIDGNNQYVVDVVATDLAENASTQTIFITVLDVDESVTWAFWTPDANGWINTDSNGGDFIGWINVADAPWIVNPVVDTFLYMEEEYVTESGAWMYVIMKGTPPASGEWAFWTPDASGWLNTNPDGGKFLGWLNVYQAPWILSASWDKWIYAEENMVTSAGSWVYVFLTPPDSAG